MTPSLTLVRVFDRSWAAWLHGVESCRRKPTRRPVHTLRIDCRRLQALLGVLGHTTGAPPKALRRLGDVAAEALNALSALRDDQVHRRRISDGGRPRHMEALLEDVRRRQSRHKKRAQKALARIDLVRADETAERVRRAVVNRQGAPTPHERIDRLSTAMDEALATVAARIARVDPERPRTLHKLRVAIKQCRYIAEIAEEVAPGIQVPAQPALRSLQRRLGAVHDADVLGDRIARFGKRHRKHRKALRTLQARVEAERVRGLRGLSRPLTALNDALSAHRTENRIAAR
jgi:CHAD domain-containing protein